MINLDAFMQALKSTWIRRLLMTSNKWQVYIKAHVDIENLANCSMISIEKNIRTLKTSFGKMLCNLWLILLEISAE